jgi:hypothetical protein
VKASTKDAMACEEHIYLSAATAALEGVAKGFAAGWSATG